MRLATWLLMGCMGLSSAVSAAENIVGEDKKTELEISIYNNDLALVKEQRKVELKQGVNDIAFEGVEQRDQLAERIGIVGGRDVGGIAEGVGQLAEDAAGKLHTPGIAQRFLAAARKRAHIALRQGQPLGFGQTVAIGQLGLQSPGGYGGEHG